MARSITLWWAPAWLRAGATPKLHPIAPIYSGRTLKKWGSALLAFPAPRARWGVCGAAASAGMAYAIVRGNAPLRDDGWQEGRLMVSELLAAIVRSGSPRCCKRDARVAAREAIPYFNALRGPQLRYADSLPVCATFTQNTVCMGAGCPFHPAQCGVRRDTPFYPTSCDGSKKFGIVRCAWRDL